MHGFYRCPPIRSGPWRIAPRGGARARPIDGCVSKTRPDPVLGAPKAEGREDADCQPMGHMPRERSGSPLLAKSRMPTRGRGLRELLGPVNGSHAFGAPMALLSVVLPKAGANVRGSDCRIVLRMGRTLRRQRAQRLRVRRPGQTGGGQWRTVRSWREPWRASSSGHRAGRRAARCCTGCPRIRLRLGLMTASFPR